MSNANYTDILRPLRTKQAERCMCCGNTISAGAELVYCSGTMSAELASSIVYQYGLRMRKPEGVGVVCPNCLTFFVRRCSCCGLLFFIDPVTEACDIAFTCSSCACNTSHRTTCSECKKTIEEGEARYRLLVVRGQTKVVCEKCREELKNDKTKELKECSKCFALAGTNNTTNLFSISFTPKKKRPYKKSVVLCSECAATEKVVKCYVCGKHFRSSDVVKVSDVPEWRTVVELGAIASARVVCNCCRPSINTVCSVCRNPMFTKSAICSHCRTDGRSHVLNYTFEPEFRFVGEPPYFGMEIEVTGFPDVQSRNKASDAIHRGVGKGGRVIYQKSDASIGRYGIEFCFHPRSIHAWFSNEGLSLLREFRETVSKYGGHSYKTGLCGLHIHRSDEDIRYDKKRHGKKTNMGIVKWLASLVSIEPYVLVLAQRSGMNAVVNEGSPGYRMSDYGSFVFMKKVLGEHGLDDKPLVDWYRDVRDGLKNIDRHGAVSISTGMPTIEYRFFRGTTNVDTILAYLAFAYFIAEWSKVTNLSQIRKMNQAECWDSLCSFIRSSSETKIARHFAKYAKSRKVM